MESQLPLVLRTPTPVRTMTNEWQRGLRTGVGATREKRYAKGVLSHSPGLSASGGLPWGADCPPAIYPTGVVLICIPFGRSIPHVPFIKLDAMPLEQRTILCFEIKLSMVFFLLLDV